MQDIVSALRPVAAALRFPALVLCLCAGPASAGPLDFAKSLFGGGTPPETAIDPNYFLKSGPCPYLDVRSGAEALTVYDKKGSTDPLGVRYQATITDTARECRVDGATLRIKVGVAGRVIAGPKGGPGTVTIPVNVSLVKSREKMLASQIVKVPVLLKSDDLSVEFSKVVELAVPVAADEQDLHLFAGVDEKPMPLPKTAPKDKSAAR